jgi:hypothetical protein
VTFGGFVIGSDLLAGGFASGSRLSVWRLARSGWSQIRCQNIAELGICGLNSSPEDATQEETNVLFVWNFLSIFVECGAALDPLGVLEHRQQIALQIELVILEHGFFANRLAKDGRRKAFVIIILFSCVSAAVLVRMPLYAHLFIGSGSQEFVARSFLRPFCSGGFHLTQQLVPKFLSQQCSKLHDT